MMEYRAFALPGLAAALLLAGASQDTWQFAAASFEGPVSAHVERVVDGDTIEVKADIWLQQSLTIRVRIDGVDAPEMEARCDEERVRAEAARDYLERRIGNADVRLTHVAYDKYAVLGSKHTKICIGSRQTTRLWFWPWLNRTHSQA